MTKTRYKKHMPTQARLHHLFERGYDKDGKLFFKSLVKRTKNKVGTINYGYANVMNRGYPSEHVRMMFQVDCFPATMAYFNYIYEYGEFDGSVYTVDHIDGNPNNDHHTNLRLATRSQQAANRKKTGRGIHSQFTGAYWHKTANVWTSSIAAHGTRIYLGQFKDDVEAATEYDRASLIHFGEFARLNFFDSLVRLIPTKELHNTHIAEEYADKPFDISEIKERFAAI